jgi:hypothetical protein
MTDEEKAALEEAEREAAGDAGGTGEAEEEEEHGTDDEDGATDDDDGEGNGKGKRVASDKGGKSIPKSRFDRVRQERNTYRAFGTPDEIKAKLAKVAEYEKYEREVAEQEKRAADEAKRKAGEPTDEELNAGFDRALERRFGKGAAQDFEQFRDVQRRDVARTVRDSLDHIRTFLTEHNIKADDAAVDRWSRHVGTEFKMDDELAANFRDPVTQKKALDTALTRVRSELIDPALAAVGASKLETARKRREAAPSSAGRGAQAPMLDENEEYTPPKNLTDPVKRQRWWDALMARKRRELDEATE